jgi:hypothetical protein
MFQVEDLQVKLVQEKIDLEKKLKCEQGIVQNLEDQRYIIFCLIVSSSHVKCFSRKILYERNHFL